jgi:hypothetical protein
MRGYRQRGIIYSIRLSYTAEVARRNYEHAYNAYLRRDRYDHFRL